jgi:general secretion pathway protein J
MRNTFRTKSAIEANAGRYRTVRLALERMAREISMAYLSQNEDTFQAERRSLFAGKRKTDVDELRFSYFGHQRLYQDADECDTAQISYFSARDRDNGRKINLMRRETRRLANLKPEDQPNETDILCDDVTRLQIEYWDGRDKQWREEWVTTAADGQPDRLPARVRLRLTVHDERDKEVTFATETKIMMQEPLNLKPVNVPPTAGGPSGPSGPSGASGPSGPSGPTPPRPPPPAFPPPFGFPPPGSRVGG